MHKEFDTGSGVVVSERSVHNTCEERTGLIAANAYLLCRHYLNRPAVVLTPPAYNHKTSLMLCCPMTTQIKNYPFEVVIAGTPPNVVPADQVKSLDWRVRRAVGKGGVSDEEFADVRAKIVALIG